MILFVKENSDHCLSLSSINIFIINVITCVKKIVKIAYACGLNGFLNERHVFSSVLLGERKNRVWFGWIIGSQLMIRRRRLTNGVW